MERNDNVVIVGDESGLFNLNQIPLTGLILILLTGQILNSILAKILDKILRTIINRTGVNQSRHLNRIIIFVIGIIFHKILLYLGIPIESWFWTFLAKYTNKNYFALPEMSCWCHLTNQHWRLVLHRLPASVKMRLGRPPNFSPFLTIFYQFYTLFWQDFPWNYHFRIKSALLISNYLKKKNYLKCLVDVIWLAIIGGCCCIGGRPR